MKIMKKRMLSFALVLLLMMAIPMPANAEIVEDAEVPTAQVTWEATIGTSTLTLKIPASSYLLPVPIEDASIVHVTEGEAAVVTWPAGNCASHEPLYTTEPDLSYRYRLNTLVSELGYTMDSMSSAIPTFEFYTIPAGLPDGKYSYGVECTVADGEWTYSVFQQGILRGAPEPSTESAEGEIEQMIKSYTALKLIVISLD